MKGIRKAKNIMWAFLGVMFLCCLMPMRTFAAEQLETLTNLYVTGLYGSETLPQQKVNWQKAGDAYYLYLPAGTSNQVQLYFSGNLENGTVLLDEQTINSGDSIDLTDKTSLELSLTDSSVTVNIMHSANIPAMFIQTESGSMDYVHANKNNKEAGTMALVKSDGNVDFDDDLKQIKGRGNSTWGFAKKPYNIKLKKSEDLLGMGKEKSWSLLANYRDRSLLRNRIVYDLAEEVGISFTMDSRNIDLYINGDYMGDYQLTEKIEVGENRVDIVDLEKASETANPDVEDLGDLSLGGEQSATNGTQKWVNIPNDPEDITGGYLMEMELKERYGDEISGFVTTGGQAVVMKYPEYASEAQMKYISAFYQKMEDALYSEDGYMTDESGQKHHYSEYLDVTSFARMYLLQEFSMNLDTGITSFYLYKDSDTAGDGKIHAAPVWDFDSALGNFGSRNGVNLQDPTKWYAKIAKMYENGNRLNVMAQAAACPEIWEEAERLWDAEFVPAIKVLMGQSEEGENAYQPRKLKTLEAYAQEVQASAAMNFVKFRDQMENPQNYGGDGFVDTGRSFDANITYLSNFLERRYQFLNRNLSEDGMVTLITENLRFKAADAIVNSNGDIRGESTSDEDGGDNLGYCNAGTWVEYKIKTEKSAIYDIAARVASPNGSGKFTISIDGSEVLHFSALSTGGYQNWQTTEAQQMELTAGKHTMRISFTESGMNLNWLQFTKIQDLNTTPSVSEKTLESTVELITEIMEKNDSKYTGSSAEALQKAIDHANELLAGKKATEEELRVAYSEVIDAVLALQMKGDKSVLEKMLTKAEEILADSSKYVKNSIDELSAEAEKARKISEKEESLQSEIDESVKELTLKIAAVRLLGDTDNDGKITTMDTVRILRCAAELEHCSEETAASADINGDGIIDTKDAVLTLRMAAEF